MEVATETAVEKVKDAVVETVQETVGHVVYAPIEGHVVSLEKVEDGVFSEAMLGKGVAIEPTVGTIVVPFDGTVSVVYTTKHAIAITSEEGVEVLLHIGIDTVQLNGRYYDIKAEQGQKVKKGDLIGYFDIEGIQKEGYRTITPVIITNTDSYKDVVGIEKDNVKCEEAIINIVAE